MGRVLVASLRVRDPQRRGFYLDFPPGTSEEDIVAAGITVTNEGAWTTGPEPSDAPPAAAADEPDGGPAGRTSAVELETPPRGGEGSGRDAWATFAAAHDVDVDENMSRDEIIAELEEQGIIE